MKNIFALILVLSTSHAFAIDYQYIAPAKKNPAFKLVAARGANFETPHYFFDEQGVLRLRANPTSGEYVANKLLNSDKLSDQIYKLTDEDKKMIYSYSMNMQVDKGCFVVMEMNENSDSIKKLTLNCEKSLRQ